jgi:hypothetical protein
LILIEIIEVAELRKNLISKALTIGILLLFIGISITSNINAGALIEEKSDGIKKDSYNLFFCFIESGYVRHVITNITGFYLSYPFAICIGNIILNLTAFHQQPDETRLTIRRISDTWYFGCNVSVVLKGFIGKIQPTGSISGGF